MSVFPVPGAAFRGLASLLGPATAKKAVKAGRGLKNVGFDFSNPMTALGIGVPTSLLAAGLAKGGKEAVGESLFGMQRDIEQELRNQRLRVAQRLKADRLQQAIASNMTRLAAANPQLYNKLLAGRTLPEGAVLLGGGRRTDFLESVAYQMATGGFGTPTSSTDPIQAIVDSY